MIKYDKITFTIKVDGLYGLGPTQVFCQFVEYHGPDLTGNPLQAVQGDSAHAVTSPTLAVGTKSMEPPWE